MRFHGTKDKSKELNETFNEKEKEVVETKSYYENDANMKRFLREQVFSKENSYYHKLMTYTVSIRIRRI